MNDQLSEVQVRFQSDLLLMLNAIATNQGRAADALQAIARRLSDLEEALSVTNDRLEGLVSSASSIASDIDSMGSG